MRSEDASALPADYTPIISSQPPVPSYYTTMTSSQPPVPTLRSVSSFNQSGRLALAIGLPIGVLLLACVLLFLFLYRRKRQRSTYLDLQNTPDLWSPPSAIPGPPLPGYRNQAPPSVRTSMHTGPVYTVSSHVAETTTVTMPPPYEDDYTVDAPSLRGSGANAPYDLKQ